MNFLGLLILTFAIFHVSAALHTTLLNFSTLKDDFRFLDTTITSTKQHIDTTAAFYTSTTTVFIPECEVNVSIQPEFIFCNFNPDGVRLLRSENEDDILSDASVSQDPLQNEEVSNVTDAPVSQDPLQNGEVSNVTDSLVSQDSLQSREFPNATDSLVSQDSLQSREVPNVTEFPEGFEHFVRVILPQIGPELEKEMMNLEPSRSDLSLPNDGGSRDDKFLKVEVKETWTSVVNSVFDVVSIVYSTSASTISVTSTVTVYQTVLNLGLGFPLGVIECF